MPQLPMGDIGPVQVVWMYGESGEMALDPYLGDATLNAEDDVHPVQEEKWGKSEVDAVFGGTTMELEVPFTRNSLAMLEEILQGTLDVVNSSIKLTAKSGCAMLTSAHAIVLKPICDGVPSVDQTEWIHLYHCHPYRKWALTFNREGQRVFLTGFKVFMSQESGQVGEFGVVGVV